MTDERREPLTAADYEQIAEGIEHFIIGMDADPEVEVIWQPHIDKLRRAASERPDLPPDEPMNLRLFKDEQTGKWFIRGFGARGWGETPDLALRDLARGHNAAPHAEQWPVSGAERPSLQGPHADYLRGYRSGLIDVIAALSYARDKGEADDAARDGLNAAIFVVRQIRPPAALGLASPAPQPQEER